MSIRFSARYARSFSVGMRPILFLHRCGGDEALLKELEGLKTHSVYLDDGRDVGAWRRLEENYNSSSIGLIAEVPGAAIRILSDGFAGAAMPGAMALLGWGARDFAALMDVSQTALRPERVAARLPPVDWPELRAILHGDDPDLGPSMQVVRKLRAAQVPIDLEVLSDVTEIACELDRFFTTFLTPVFPKMT